MPERPDSGYSEKIKAGETENETLSRAVQVLELARTPQCRDLLKERGVEFLAEGRCWCKDSVPLTPAPSPPIPRETRDRGRPYRGGAPHCWDTKTAALAPRYTATLGINSTSRHCP